MTPARAHDTCLTDVLYGSDPNCRAHWNNYLMPWHFDGRITADHHAGERDRFHDAKARWRTLCCPNSPFYTDRNNDAPTHVEMHGFNDDLSLGIGEIGHENGDAHVNRVRDFALRHNIGDLSCSGRPCDWYTGTGDPPATKIDAWSVWQEETGHAQNISHFGSSCTATMSGCTAAGSVGKRTPGGHSAFHACDPYRRVHEAC